MILDVNYFGPYDFSAKASNFYEVEAASINEDAVVEILKSTSEEVIIYSGGGIVKDPVFEIGVPLMHTHPGFLPHVRGSHGIYWSALLRGNFGCTTFYMNGGIDTGSIIRRVEYDFSMLPKINGRFF